MRARTATAVWETETSLLHALALVRPPVAVQWIATSACDLHCPHCYSSAGRRAPDELTTEEARTLLVDELAALASNGAPPTLVFAGGEMSLRRDMPELIEYAVGKGLRYAIHTHGAHVERLRDVFTKHPPDLAAISLDGDEATHDRFRGRTGSYAAALRAIAMLREVGCPEIVVGTTVTRDNADDLAALFPIVARSGAHTWGLHLFAPEGRGAQHLALLPTPAQLRRVVELARRKRASFHVELCNEWGSAGADDVYLRDQPFACGAGRISFVVASNGDVMPCTTTDAAEREGNVRERPLAEVWSRGFGRFRRPGEDPTLDPRECWLQTRNGVEIRHDAFGPSSIAPPLPLERLTHRVVARLRSHAPAQIASPRAAAALRWAAVGIAFLDGCVQQVTTPSAPPSTPVVDDVPSTPPPTGAHHELTDEFPATLEGSPTTHWMLAGQGVWLATLGEIHSAESSDQWTGVESSVAPLLQIRVAIGLAETVTQYARARREGRTETLAELFGLLNALEGVPAYNTAFAAFIWRRARALPASTSASIDERALLFARLHLHLRVADALVQGQGATTPVEYTAWRSKAAPPRGWTPGVVVPPDLVAKAKAAFDRRPSIPWDRVAASVVVVGEDADATLVRDGRSAKLAAGVRIAFGRLDIVRATTALRLRGDGGLEATIPAGTELTLDQLGQRLDAKQRAELDALVERAMNGDTKADARIETILPWVHDILRARLKTQPDHAAAGKLRLWLTTFDE